jgi:hypothetical protein
MNEGLKPTTPNLEWLLCLIVTNPDKEFVQKGSDSALFFCRVRVGHHQCFRVLCSESFRGRVGLTEVD